MPRLTNSGYISRWEVGRPSVVPTRPRTDSIGEHRRLARDQYAPENYAMRIPRYMITATAVLPLPMAIAAQRGELLGEVFPRSLPPISRARIAATRGSDRQQPRDW